MEIGNAAATALSLATGALGTGAVTLVLNTPTNQPCEKSSDRDLLGSSGGDLPLCENVFGGLAEVPSGNELFVLCLFLSLAIFVVLLVVRS